jgi:hypothetical protein
VPSEKGKNFPGFGNLKVKAGLQRKK